MYLIFLLPFVMISCSKDKTTQTNNKEIQPITLTTAQKALIQSNNQFAFTLFNKAANNETKQNLFISPISVSIALSMTMNGAAGSTLTGMVNTLGFGSAETSTVNDYNKLLSQQLQNIDSQVQFNIANSIWYRNTFSVLPSFLTTNQNYYNAEVSALDFNSSSAVNTINNWVSAKTNKEIPTIIDQIDPSNVMFLINAIYFKGSWRNQYEVSKTLDQNFYKEDQSVVKCKMMMQDITFPLYSNDIFSAVEMPYGQGNFVMTVLLPADGKTTSDIVATFNADNWKTLNDGLIATKVHINMPKFKMTYETSLNSLLIAMGMSDAFSPMTAKFTGINSGGGLYISSVKHKTMINVDEEGTIAAAVTSVGMTMTAIEQGPPIFNINKPFVFVLSEKSTGAILFTGRMMDPTM